MQPNCHTVLFICTEETKQIIGLRFGSTTFVTTACNTTSTNYLTSRIEFIRSKLSIFFVVYPG